MTAKTGVFARALPVHVVLIPLALPLLFAAAYGIFVGPTAAMWSVVVTWVGVLVSWAGLTSITRNHRTSALMVSVVGFGLFVDAAMTRALGAASSVATALVWLVLLMLCVVVGRSGRDARAATAFANVLALILCGSSCYSIAIFEVERPGPRVKPGYLDTLAVLPAQPQEPLPDIYMIVLDGYGRSDVLRRLFGFDDPLAQHLRARGFYVADRAFSNYCQTATSLASSLNLDYLPTLLTSIPTDAISRRAYGTLIAENRTFQAFRRAGYRIVTFSSEYTMVHFNRVDRHLRPPFYLTDFEYGLYDASSFPRLSRLVHLPEAWLPHQIRRYGVQWTLDRLADGSIADGKQPTLIFVHLLLPHPPFVFRPDGSYSRGQSAAGLFDANHWRQSRSGTDPSYEAGYLDNLRFLGNRLVPVIDAILKQTTRPRVVLIDGDHGPGSRLHWENVGASDLQERHGILMAVRFPDGDTSGLYPMITPLNAMRTVLNQVLGVGLPLIEDRAFFSTWSRPSAFEEVTVQVR